MAARSLTVILAALLVGTSIGTGLLGNVRPAKADPAITTSEYIGLSGAWTPTDFYNMGCSRGAAGQIGSVILGFGKPFYQSGYGTVAPGNGQFISISTLRLRSRSFAQGFWACASGGAYVTLIVGTSNFGSGTADTTHGSEWAYMVNQLQSEIVVSG